MKHCDKTKGAISEVARLEREIARLGIEEATRRGFLFMHEAAVSRLRSRGWTRDRVSVSI